MAADAANDKQQLEPAVKSVTVADLLAPPEPEIPASGTTDREVMRRRLRTATGRAAYKKRKETVEPVFGIIKSAMGFRRFLLRGIRKVALEWSLVTLAYNFRTSPRSRQTCHKTGKVMRFRLSCVFDWRCGQNKRTLYSVACGRPVCI